MTFTDILARFTAAVHSGDGQALAALFTPDGVYVDGFYGPSAGRDAIAHMLEEHFHGAAKDFRWQMLDPVCDGATGYARWLFSYTSTLPGAEGKRAVFEGMSRFELRDGLIARYTEVFDRGLALAQLGFAPERIARTVGRAAERLRAAPEAGAHLG
jgi:uncharacterized protein (TIGR02246 family)